MVIKMLKSGGKDGEYFLCLVRNYLESTMAMSGVYLTIYLLKVILNEKFPRKLILRDEDWPWCTIAKKYQYTF